MNGRPGAGRAALAVAFVASLPVLVRGGGEASRPVDCLPEVVVEWVAAQPDPDLRFGAANLPGIVLGPPGDSSATTGSTSVASLGNGGHAVLEFRDIVIEDGPGPDFIVFENPFFVGAPPAGPDDDFQIFAEPGTVEVSADGQTWLMFPFDQAALDQARGSNINKDTYLRLQGLAGLTPTFTGNWTVPNDPSTFDPNGVGGISGAGGDAFDLADVGLAEARFLRITDTDFRNGPPGSAEGFDLDAVVVLHGRPWVHVTADTDGDGLSDDLEQNVFASSPIVPDTDGDGEDDGREAARCRDPNSSSGEPWFQQEPQLWVRDKSCTELRWTFLGSPVTYDVIRGDLANLFATATGADLGPADCLAAGSAGVRYACDAAVPAPGGAFTYLVRATGRAHYGYTSSFGTRETASGCP